MELFDRFLAAVDLSDKRLTGPVAGRTAISTNRCVLDPGGSTGHPRCSQAFLKTVSNADSPKGSVVAP